MHITIQGIGVLGGFGTGVAELEAALRTGQPQSGTARVGWIGDEDGFSCFRADTTVLSDFVPKRALRRIDHQSQMAVLAACLALEDAGQLDSSKQNMGVVVASGYGASRTTFAFLDSIIDHGDTCASPTHFSNSVHNAAAAHIAILLNATGPNVTVSQLDRSFPAALLVAMQWLAEERVESVLVGGVDEYCSVLGYCWDRFFPSEHKTRAGQPDAYRPRATIGEGASFLYLSGERAVSPSYGFLKAIQIGNLRSGHLQIPTKTVIIFNSDGSGTAGHRCTRHVPPGQKVVAYGSLYGQLPVGMGFDVAAGGLAIKTDTVFPTIAAPSASRINAIDKAQKLGGRNICCLQVNPAGHFSMAVLNNNPNEARAF